MAPATQACQAAHAALEFSLTYPAVTADWCKTSGTLVLLAVDDELSLGRVHVDAVAIGLRAAAFYEPDLGGALTAIALEPAAGRLLARVPLALAGFTSSTCGEEVTS